MAGFLYFLPGAQQDYSADELRAEGLGHVVEGCRRGRPSVSVCLKGPTGDKEGTSGAGGVIVADPQRLGTAALGYYPDEQIWRRPDPSLPWLMGWYRAAPPAPADLEKPALLESDPVTLAGAAWLTPLLRRYDARHRVFSTPLPRQTRRTAAGWITGDVVAEYQLIYERGERAWEQIFDAFTQANFDDDFGGEEESQAEVATEIDDLIDFACDLLAMNYVLSPWEASELGLMDADGPEQILKTSLAWQTFLAAALERQGLAPPAPKKNEPAGSDTPKGATDAITPHGDAA